MCLRDIGIMAKKAFIKPLHKHVDCAECKAVLNEFLSISGKPILGECSYSNVRFLLNEETACKYYRHGI